MAGWETICHRPTKWWLFSTQVRIFDLVHEFQGRNGTMTAAYQVEQKQLRGGRVLNFLHEQCHCGVPELQHAFKGFFGMDSRLVSAWMAYGLLQDQNQELFISRTQEEGNQAIPEAPHAGGDKLKASRVAEDARMVDRHTGFCVCLDMLPDYIPLQVAESILLVGKAVRVLRNPSASFQKPDG